MLTELVEKVSLFRILHRIDTDLCNQHRQKGCPYCGGPLHQSNYERKPRGGPDNIPDEYLIRQSLCCGRPECRRRALPQSCLFMGRRVYWGCVILVVMAFKQNRPHAASARKINERLDRNDLSGARAIYQEHAKEHRNGLYHPISRRSRADATQPAP